ncbi:hypothetical protein MMON_58530 [Mycolicibacterium monacense]|uniref:Uncharacterized protein n=1 Tax=Mycolicibacterium monacense TaxID=85693 RepID=A0AAD1N2R2_MYCMB|nr:hypothetical protein MMON_58530 [Mycolicibacterium monacense]
MSTPTTSPDRRVRIRLVGRDRGTGIVGWSLRGLPGPSADLDGIATTASEAAGAVPPRTPTA